MKIGKKDGDTAQVGKYVRVRSQDALGDAVEEIAGDAHRFKYFSLSLTLSHSSASAGASFFSTMGFHFLASSAFKATNCCWSAGRSASAKIALAGHSGTHSAQSMHSSGSITRKFSPSRKQSTGHTSTQSVYLQRMQFSATM